MRSSKIPVVVLDDQETQRLREQLAEAGRGAAVAHLRLDFIDPKPPHVLKLQVKDVSFDNFWGRHRPR